MAVDYDLIIIGSSWEGIYAAKQGAQLQARVALVTQSEDWFLPDDTLFNHSFREVGHLNYQLAGNLFATESEKLPYISLAEAGNWARGINSLEQTQNSLSSLAASGVDVILGKGEFCPFPKLAFQVQKRKLYARNFLLTTGTNFIPQFGGKNLTSGYLTPKDFWQQDFTDCGQNIIVVGDDPTALELAQTLGRFDKKVTLVAQKPRILPQEDPEVALLIQAQLEAEGIKIYTNSPLSQLKTIEQQKWIQAGDRALIADEILITDCRQPNIAGLNLAGANVKYSQTRVYVNQKLQTTNPNIFACGDLIGGYNLPNITSYEVNLILKNTLFFSGYQTNYFSLPWVISTQPTFARVGLNELQAKQQQGSDLYIIKEYLTDIASAQISEQTSGICKLLVRTNGEILGCSLFCDRAEELITVIALMIEHKIRLKQNPMRGLTDLSIPFIYPSMTEILQRASHNFYQQKLERNPQLLRRLRSWFSLRKQWHR